MLIGKEIIRLKRQKRRKILVYGLLMLFILSISGVAWAAPADTKSSEQKGNETQAVSLFKDVTGEDGNLIYINYLAKKELVSGFPDGGFHPAEGLTRAEAATVLVKAAGLNQISENKAVFKDVSNGHWAAGFIAAAAAAGYLKGYPDGTYRPEEKLSRAQGISLILRLSKQKDTGVELPELKDLDSKHWAARSVAIGLAAGMVGLSKDKSQFLPDENFSRGDLSRALAVLLTTDPDMSRTALNGSLEIKKGEVKVNDKNATGTVNIKVGDQIATSAGGEARLSYPDGSGLLITENTKIAVKEAQGRSYIKKDGSPGTAVDWLLIDLKTGNVFGALATNPNVQNSTEKKTAALGERLLASLSGGLGVLAANEKDMPWYQAASTKKVKVKVDMPYGVAAVRGSFWSNMVTGTGSTTSLLEGELELSAGGQTAALPPGQSSSVSSSNPVPTAPALMSAAQVNSWVQQSAWLQNVAQTMQAQQAAVLIPPVISGTPPPPIQVFNIVDTLNQALTQIQQAIGIKDPIKVGDSKTENNNSGNTPPNNDDTSTRRAGWRLEDVATTVYNNQTVALTRNLYITPPAGVSASRYDVTMKSGTSTYYLGSRSIGSPILHLAKASEDISKLIVIFHNSSSSCGSNSIYSLAGTGSSGTLTNLATRTISGRIDLQSASGTVAAPAGGLPITITASGNSIGGYITTTQAVTMPAGASTVNYTLNVPDNYDSNSDYYIQCSVDDSDYTKPYICDTGVTATVLSGNVSDKNLVIRPGKYLSGTLTLPAANSSSHWVSGTIKAQADSGSVTFSQYFTINKDQSTFAYHLPVLSGKEYTIHYELYNSNYTFEHQCYKYGYYSTVGGSVHTVAASNSYPVPSDATKVPVVNDNVSGINLNVLTGYGYLISGHIKLPGTEVAPDGGIDLGGFYISGSGSPSAGSPAGTCDYIAGGASSAKYFASVSASGTYTLEINKYGSNGSGITNPPLYKLDPVSVTVYAANVSQDLTLVSIGSSGGGGGAGGVSITGLPPGIVTGPALLLGRTVYGLGSSQYTASIAAGAKSSSWYFKDADGNWFNLRNFTSATALTASNKTELTAVPPIGLISGSAELTPNPAICFPGYSISVSPASGSGLWGSNNTVKAILNGETGIVPNGPLEAACTGNDTASFTIPCGIELGNYSLTLYKESESGGVYTLLGVAKFNVISIT